MTDSRDSLSVTPVPRPRTLKIAGLLAWFVLMAPLLRWGLPSSQDDDLLFGGAPPWKADRYGADADLHRLRTPSVGADVDLNPLPDRTRLTDLTATDEARAEILRRYRLYSRQPDEMIIFRALQRMNPRTLDLDPGLYQYGGGYVYLIGAVTGLAGAIGLIRLSSDVGLYLERPEYFAGFYLAARFVSLVFGALLLVAVGRLARRTPGGRAAGFRAMLLVACTPVFFSGVLEAKPHLPSACLILWACLSALDYVERGRWRDALRLGLQAGYACGLVLTGCVVFALWPMVWWRRHRTAAASPPVTPHPSTSDQPAGPQPTAWATVRHLLGAGLVALAVYAATNPYVIYNALTRRGALSSNLANSLAMYRDQVGRTPAGVVRVSSLLNESVGIGGVVAGTAATIGVLYLLCRRRTAGPALVAAPGLVMLCLCAMLAAGKPAEFARFLILPAVLLMTGGAVGAVITLRNHGVLDAVVLAAILLTLKTPAYAYAFFADAWTHQHSRRQAGAYLAAQLGPHDTIGVVQEPAPYSVPPLDFTRQRVLLLPPAYGAELRHDDLPAWLVFIADDHQVYADAWWQKHYRLAAAFPIRSPGRSVICWANKPVFVYRRTDEAP